MIVKSNILNVNLQFSNKKQSNKRSLQKEIYDVYSTPK